jgi:hypothetical protein
MLLSQISCVVSTQQRQRRRRRRQQQQQHGLVLVMSVMPFPVLMISGPKVTIGDPDCTMWKQKKSIRLKSQIGLQVWKTRLIM